MRKSNEQRPVVLFGAFDRHNFGDLLFPHIVARMFEEPDTRVAGLAARDLREFGGHRVETLSQLREPSFDLVHVGGELLTCDAWEAAVMLQTPVDAQKAIAAGKHGHQRFAWAAHTLGTQDRAPYVVSRDSQPSAARVIFHAVGGVALNERDEALRSEVLARLATADNVSVRDSTTQAVLAQHGIKARLVPDCAVMAADLFRQRIARHAAALKRLAPPQHYLAVQFSADYGDDATLARIAAQLGRVARSHDLGIVFFRAGAAPWHDDLSCFERTAARMRAPFIHVFESLNIWDICALIAHSRAYAGSSLHGRIVAMAFARPRINLLRDDAFDRPSKQIAFAETWEDADVPRAVPVHRLADGIDAALSVDQQSLDETAKRLVARYRSDFRM